MARGSLPEQTPPVPQDLFFAFNDLYLYVRQLSEDLKRIEDSPLLSVRNMAAWLPAGNSTTIIAIGAAALTATGTATTANVATTNMYTYQRCLEYLVTVAAANAVSGFRYPAMQWTIGGPTANLGGFRFTCRFGLATGVSVATHRCFVGMRNSTGAPTDVNPSTLTNNVGIGWDSADTNIQFMYRGAGAVKKIDLGTAFPRPTANRTAVYEVELYAPPGTEQSVAYKLIDLTTGAIAVGVVTTDLPTTATLLAPRGYFSVGGTSSVVGMALSAGYMRPLY